MLTADHIAVGECSVTARPHPPDGGDGRLLQQLRRAAHFCHARYRRYGGCRTAIGSSRCSTPITTSAASCQSTFTTRRRAGRLLCFSALAKRPRAPRCAAICAELVRRIRRHWPATHITIRGDGHYGRPQVMAWCEENGIDFIFGLPGNAVLADAVEET